MHKSNKHYHDINIILATKHQKERAISAPFNEAFGASIFVPTDYDTDEFGTFTGEIERKGTPYETVIEKAKKAMKRYDYSYGIASEGSFGPHPTLFFMPGTVELMSFVDMQNDLIVVESEVTTDTNFNHVDITNDNDYEDFLEKIKFGSHGLIVKNLTTQSILAKGITQRRDLDMVISHELENGSIIRLETDMRAMMNPTRMNVIHQLTKKLVDRLMQTCPGCQSPGFGKISVTGNLPCHDCGTATDLYHSKLLHCVKCDYQETQPRDDGAIQADAKYCPYCNP